MKKRYIILIIGLILLAIGFGFYFYISKHNQKSNSPGSSNYMYDATKVSTNNEISKDLSNTENTNTSSENSDKPESRNENQLSVENNTNEAKNEAEAPVQEAQPEPELKKEETETQIADFTTKIYTKDSERQNNISITCSTLNDTTVNNGETFSFCNTVGKATSSKGYQKADVYQDGEVIQALGGGNCQVSTTLYNAILKVDGLSVTERHEHSNSVPYVSKGKDAAVAYGSYDLKFVNHTGNKIKISASTDKSFVYIKIFSLKD